MNRNEYWVKYFFLVVELELLIRSNKDNERADAIRDELDWYFYMTDHFMIEFVHDLVRQHLDKDGNAMVEALKRSEPKK